VDRYKPIENFVSREKNPGVEDHCSWNNRMFETYGEELAAVEAADRENPRKVWTITEVDDDENPFVIQSGMRFVNRFGYMITEEEFAEGEEITVHDED
jgi:hypothetical protein